MGKYGIKTKKCIGYYNEENGQIVENLLARMKYHPMMTNLTEF